VGECNNGIERLVLSRAEAIERGLLRYIGKPCKHGHVAERFTSNGHCVLCDRKHGSRWRAANPERARELRQRWKIADREKLRKTARQYNAAKVAAHPCYRCWSAMVQRCENPNNHKFAVYGGRGVTIHPRYRYGENGM
jgi:hypothetical protein